MMKKTQRKDAIRNIRRHEISFLSIAVVAALAIMAYLGLHFASKAMLRAADRFYEETNFRDVEIVSSLLVTEADMNAVLETEGVADAEPVWQTSGLMKYEESKEHVTVISLTRRINVPLIVSGRLPATVNECVVDSEIATPLGISVGDRIKIENAQYLSANEFFVCGIVKSADFACNKLVLPGQRYITVLPETFDTEALGGCAMKAIVKYDGLEGVSFFSDRYDKLAKSVTDRIRALSDTLSDRRTGEIKDAYQSEIEKGEQALEEAGKELDEGKSGLDEGKVKLDSGAAELASGKAKLDSGKAELAASKEKLAQAKTELEKGESEYQTAGEELKSKKAEVEDAERKLDDAREALIAGGIEIDSVKNGLRDSLRTIMVNSLGEDIANRISWAEADPIDIDDESVSLTHFPVTQELSVDLSKSLAGNIADILSLLMRRNVSESELSGSAKIYLRIAGYLPEDNFISVLSEKMAEMYRSYNGRYEELASAARTWNGKHDEYIAAKKKLTEGKAQLSAAEQDYRTARKTLDEGWAEYYDGLAKYRSGLSEYDAGLNSYNNRRSEYDAGLSEYNARLKEYNEGLAEYEAGREKLENAKSELSGMDPCSWVVLTPEGNASFIMVGGAAENVAQMGMTFAFMFIVIGAFVIYATLGRMVEQQRKVVGVMKAQGYYPGEVLKKYMIYGEGATVLGIVLGILCGWYYIQKLLVGIYGRYYVYDSIPIVFDPALTAMVAVCGVALAAFAVYNACSSLLKGSATNLMNEKAPEIKRRAHRSERKSLYSRLTVRNMLTDKKRVAVTVISIAGCCTLLIAGFTMRFSVFRVMNRNFDEVYLYDEYVLLTGDEGEDGFGTLESELKKAGADVLRIYGGNMLFTVNDAIFAGNVFCGDLDALQDYFSTRDLETGSVITEDTDGIWFYMGLLDNNDVKVGDKITVYDQGMRPYEAEISGFFQHYVGRDIVMNRATYASVFGKEPKDNALLINNGDASADEIERILSSSDAVESVNYVAKTREEYLALSSVVDIIALLLTAVAGIMSFFVILNLVSMLIQRKKNELTVMRINGFTVWEVKKYLLRESVFTTVTGTVTGLFTGLLLGYRVLTLIQGRGVHFVGPPEPKALILGAAITVIFSVVIHFFGLRRIKDLNLTDLT